MPVSPPSARQRTRTAVRADVMAIAHRLFVESGYDAVTVEQVAAAAGVSRRTLFRWFPAKDDLVVAKYDLLGEQLLAALDERPVSEPVWPSLRRVLDVVVEYFRDPTTVAIQLIVQRTPALEAAYLQRSARVQRALAQRIRERAAAERGGAGRAGADPVPDAVVGAAFACVLAAQDAWHADGARTFAEHLDDAMGAFEVRDRVRPRG